MNCAGSVKKIGDESSEAGLPAMMGTAAHKVVENMLTLGQTDAESYHNCNILVYKPGTHETVILPPGKPPKLEPDWYLFVCDDIMVAGVQMMIDEVERIKTEECFDPVLYTERYLDMTWLDPRFGGTADVTLVDVDWIHLFDYKNGRITVEVKDNEQFGNYAVGLLHEHPEARGVTVHLIQPNALHEDGCIREQTYTADELKLFELQMKQAAEATERPNATLRAGDWCTFCPAKSRCEEFESRAREECQMDFASDPAEVPTPSLADVGDIFNDDDDGAGYRAALARKAKWIPLLDQWARDINQAILNEMMNGRAVPGKKLVQGKSNRAWENKEATADALVAAGLPGDHLWTEPELKSPAQVEKIRPPGLKPAAIKKIVAGLAFKPPGRITVADESDPREAVDPAAAAIADFATDPAETEGDFAP